MIQSANGGLSMIKFHAECIPCLMKSAINKAESVEDPALRARYVQEMCRIFAEMDAEHDSAPLADERITRLRGDMLGVRDDYTEVKRTFNGLLLSMQDRLRDQIEASGDPLYASLQLSVAGNYIDFGVLTDVSEDQLMRLLSKAHDYQLDRAEYEALRKDLEKAKRCTVLHDNCGEIVLDRLMIEQIRKRFPEISVTSVVRGSAVINDVTLNDAAQVRLSDVAQVISNGTPGIPGTQIDLLPDAVRSVLEQSDVIIAKGQGNFETMLDTELNAYFLLLAKCEHYAKWFGLPRFSCVLANANRMRAKMGI